MNQCACCPLNMLRISDTSPVGCYRSDCARPRNPWHFYVVETTIHKFARFILFLLNWIGHNFTLGQSVNITSNIISKRVSTGGLWTLSFQCNPFSVLLLLFCWYYNYYEINMVIYASLCAFMKICSSYVRALSLMYRHRWSSSLVYGHRWSSSLVYGHRWSLSLVYRHRWSSSLVYRHRWSSSLVYGIVGKLALCTGIVGHLFILDLTISIQQQSTTCPPPSKGLGLFWNIASNCWVSRLAKIMERFISQNIFRLVCDGLQSRITSLHTVKYVSVDSSTYFKIKLNYHYMA